MYPQFCEEQENRMPWWPPTQPIEALLSHDTSPNKFSLLLKIITKVHMQLPTAYISEQFFSLMSESVKDLHTPIQHSSDSFCFPSPSIFATQWEAISPFAESLTKPVFSYLEMIVLPKFFDHAVNHLMLWGV
jgi:hypothetical protein